MVALENARKFLQACEFQLLGWAGCREYVAEGATFHSPAASYEGLNTEPLAKGALRGGFFAAGGKGGGCGRPFLA